MSERIDGRSWSPAPGLVALTWIVAAAGAAWCAALWAAGSDPAGRLLAAVAALGFGAIALFGTRARPRLVADVDGLTVGGLVRARHHPWPLVRTVRVRRTRRLGREAGLLEIDTVTATGDERLYVLGRLDLGEDPDEVAAVLVLVQELRRGP